MKVKYSIFRSPLHEIDEFVKESEEFISELSKLCGSKFELAKLEDYDCDVKLIYIESGGSEGLFLANIEKLQGPFFLLTNGAHNSLAASLEILTYLNLNGLVGEILHGSNEYVANRIIELGVLKEKTKYNKLFGIIGKPSDWLISSIPSYDLVYKKFRYKLINIPLEEVILLFQTVSFNKFKDDNGFDFNTAEKFTKCLKEIKNKYHLDGLTIRCFDLLNSISSTGCLALAHLNDEGVTSACEGDVMAMISMEIIKEISGKTSFQANPSEIDSEKNEVIFAHCSVPFSMLQEFSYDTHFESKIGVAIKGKLYCDDVTVFRLSKDLKNFYVGEGRIIENLDRKDLCRTQIKVKMDDSIKPLLSSPCGNHHIIVYGRYKKEIIEYMKSIQNK